MTVEHHRNTPIQKNHITMSDSDPNPDSHTHDESEGRAETTGAQPGDEQTDAPNNIENKLIHESMSHETGYENQSSNILTGNENSENSKEQQFGAITDVDNAKSEDLTNETPEMDGVAPDDDTGMEQIDCVVDIDEHAVVDQGATNGQMSQTQTENGGEEIRMNATKPLYNKRKGLVNAAGDGHLAASTESEDVPNYMPPISSSRRKVKIGSENLITNHDLLLAATLVADALEGHRFELKTEPRYVRSYNWFKSIYLRGLLYLAILLNLTIALFEEPAVGVLATPFWATMSIECICTGYFILRLCHHAHWRLWSDFKKEVRNIFAIVCIVLTILDMFVYVIMVTATDVKAIRWSRALRPLLIMNFSDGTHLKRAWSNIRMTLNQIAHVILLFYFLIAVFSLVAMRMFIDRPDIVLSDNTAYFKDYFESFWQLYVLVTTSNNPDVILSTKDKSWLIQGVILRLMSQAHDRLLSNYIIVTDTWLPAYDKSRWYCIFFFVYVVICLYLMLNILLAVTYNSYRENMKEQILHSARMKRRTLHQAFEVIKINVEGKEMVTYKTWSRLIRLAHPGKTKYQIDLLMMVLDTDKSGYISRQQFLSVADLLNVPVSEVSERKTYLELHLPSIYLSKPSELLRKVVASIYFSLFFDGIVIGNIVCIVVEFEQADWAFVGLYLGEIVLKWYTLGTKRYFYNFQHWTDVIFTVLSLITVLLIDESDDLVNEPGQPDNETLRVINVFRIFRILRCLVEFERFRIMFDALVNVSFSIFTYSGILFSVFYAFAIVGTEIFRGKIEYLGYNDTPTESQLQCNNPSLNGSLFADNHYCNLNFNDLINSFVVLAALLVGNNWHEHPSRLIVLFLGSIVILCGSLILAIDLGAVIAEGYTLVTSKVARIYFMMFHLCVAIVVMNIVTAFILDMFMYEYTFQKKGTIDTKVEQTIKNLKLGIDDETGMDLSGQHTVRKSQTVRKFKTESVFRRLTMRQRATPKPNLSTYDGIRFHIKKRGWTKTEQLLQQLFEVDTEHHDEWDNLRMDLHMST